MSTRADIHDRSHIAQLMQTRTDDGQLEMLTGFTSIENPPGGVYDPSVKLTEHIVVNAHLYGSPVAAAAVVYHCDSSKVTRYRLLDGVADLATVIGAGGWLVAFKDSLQVFVLAELVGSPNVIPDHVGNLPWHAREFNFGNQAGKSETFDAALVNIIGQAQLYFDFGQKIMLCETVPAEQDVRGALLFADGSVEINSKQGASVPAGFYTSEEFVWIEHLLPHFYEGCDNLLRAISKAMTGINGLEKIQKMQAISLSEELFTYAAHVAIGAAAFNRGYLQCFGTANNLPDKVKWDALTGRARDLLFLIDQLREERKQLMGEVNKQRDQVKKA